jgi:GNAT superfamily N-acetyltransferase
MEHTVTTTYLEMHDPREHRVKECSNPEFRVVECERGEFRYNRLLYRLAGKDWHWTDKIGWTDEQWRKYTEDENLRTWVAFMHGEPAGYYELHRDNHGYVEIVYFGLVKSFIGKGLGGALLSHAIQSAWDWGAKRVWLHTCSLDHPHALANYLARGMKIYKTEIGTKDITVARTGSSDGLSA